MDEGMGSTALVDTTADALIGAGATITGTNENLCRGGCVSRLSGGTDQSRNSTIWLLTFCFDFWESCLLQQLIQRGEIGFEQFAPRIHYRCDLGFEIRGGGFGRGCRRGVCALDVVEQMCRRI